MSTCCHLFSRKMTMCHYRILKLCHDCRTRGRTCQDVYDIFKIENFILRENVVLINAVCLMLLKMVFHKEKVTWSQCILIHNNFWLIILEKAFFKVKMFFSVCCMMWISLFIILLIIKYCAQYEFVKFSIQNINLYLHSKLSF